MASDLGVRSLWPKIANIKQPSDLSPTNMLLVIEKAAELLHLRLMRIDDLERKIARSSEIFLSFS